MTKKTRLSDTVSGAVSSLQEAMKPLPNVPAHVKLRGCDLPFWSDILRARARSLTASQRAMIAVKSFVWLSNGANARFAGSLLINKQPDAPNKPVQIY